jgi:hypothetical protein
VVSSITESEWDDESRDWVTALAFVERNTGRNGEWLPDATSPAASPTSYDSGYRYVTDGPFTNYAEKARLDAMDAHKKAAGKEANLNGLFFTVDRLDYEVEPTS